MNPTKEEFYAAIHCLAGYPTPYEVTLLADYDRTLGIRDASTEILKKAFLALEAAEEDVQRLNWLNEHPEWVTYERYMGHTAWHDGAKEPYPDVRTAIDEVKKKYWRNMP